MGSSSDIRNQKEEIKKREWKKSITNMNKDIARERNHRNIKVSEKKGCQRKKREDSWKRKRKTKIEKISRRKRENKRENKEKKQIVWYKIWTPLYAHVNIIHNMNLPIGYFRYTCYLPIDSSDW